MTYNSAKPTTERFCPICDKLPPPQYNKVTGEIIAPRLMKI